MKAHEMVHYLLFIPAFGFTLCVAGRDQNPENPLANTNWRVESFGLADSPQMLELTKKNFPDPLEFHHNNFDGRIACNLISYAYTVNGSKIKAESMATTVMARSSNIMKLEKELSEAFREITEFRLDGDRLEFRYGDRKIIHLKKIKQIADLN